MTAERFHAWLDSVDAKAAASPTGQRFLAAGYGIQHTGGGCLAWEKIANGVLVWITDDDSLGLDGTPDYWLVGKYDAKTGDSLDIDNMAQDRATIEEAIAYGDSLIAAGV